MQRLSDFLAGALCITLILSMLAAATLILTHAFLAIAQALVLMALRGWMP